MLSRRDFSISSGSALLLGGFHSNGLSMTPAGKMRVAFIGVGGRGGSNLKAVASDERVEVAAICDVDARRLSAAHGLFPSARQYADFRKLYEDEEQFDAVVVSTAEHTHAFATMPALRLGKHVYCEKPLTHNIGESLQIMQAAEKAGVATQMGTQIHAGANYHQVVAAVQAGVVGPVRESHVWVNRAWGLQGAAASRRNKDIVHVEQRPSESAEIPENLDWDLWLGPAPYRPFHPVYFPGPKWYRWWDFGSGTMSDLGSHWNDLPFWALQLDAPSKIEASGPAPHDELAPATMSARYSYPARGERPALELTWYQGEMKPEIWKKQGIPQWSSGCLFVGPERMLLADYRKHVLMDLEGNEIGFEAPILGKEVPSSHHADWIDACFTGDRTGSPFSYAGPLTIANHLGNVAYRAGRTVHWDAQNARAMKTPMKAGVAAEVDVELEKYVRRVPRDGWSLD